MNIAIITPYQISFEKLKQHIDSGSINYIWIKNIEDCRGKEFMGYSKLHDYYKILNDKEVEEQVKLRIRN
jgi:hypothetical protein